MIELKSVIKRVGKSQHRREILSRVSCTFERGNDYVILGNRGEGKTTLLRLLCGLSRPTGGQIIRRGNVSIPPGIKILAGNTDPAREYIKLVSIIYRINYKELLTFVTSFAEIGEALDAPLSELPPPETWRLTTSIAYAIPAVFYLFDANIASGEKGFRERCDPLYDERRKTANVIHVANFASRAPAAWEGFKAAILDQGNLLFFDSFDEAVDILRENAAASTYGTLEYASLLVQEGRLLEACEYLEYYTAQHPDERSAVLLLTQLYMRLDEIEKAEACGTVFVQRFNAAGEISLMLAKIMARRNLHANAVSWAEHYLREQPESKEAHLLKARSLEKLGLYSAAGDTWESMISISTEPVAARMALRAYALAENWAEILTLVERLGAVDNTDGLIETQCKALLNLQHWPEMIEAIKRLIAIDPHAALRATSAAIGKMDLPYVPLLISTLTPVAIVDQDLRNLMSRIKSQIQRNARAAAKNGTEAEIFSWSEALAYMEDRV